MSTTATLLTYEDAKGEPLVQAVHKSVRLRGEPVKGSQAYAETPTWALEFVGRVGFQGDGGGLPHDLTRGSQDISAESLADATEALSRIGNALERWLERRADADRLLLETISQAARYGVDPELPLGVDA
jgi:hypothetical protein